MYRLGLVLVVIALASCGGGGGGGSSSTTSTASTVSVNANCPSSVQKFTYAPPTYIAANTPTTIVQTNSIVLEFDTPTSNTLQVETCIVQSNDSNFPLPPSEVVSLTGGDAVTAIILADGDFTALQNKTLSISIVFVGTQNQVSTSSNTYNVVAYIQNDAGIWTRNILPTTRVMGTIFPGDGGSLLPSAEIIFTAPITKPGYYDVTQ